MRRGHGDLLRSHSIAWAPGAALQMKGHSAMTPQRLEEDHAKIALLFGALLGRVTAGEWRACGPLWEELTDWLEAHMIAEERELFVRVVTSRPALRPIVDRFRREHDRIRAEAFKIGVAMRRGSLDPDELACLVAHVTAHAEAEAWSVYPLAVARDEAPIVDARWGARAELNPRPISDRTPSVEVGDERSAGAASSTPYGPGLPPFSPSAPCQGRGADVGSDGR